MYAAQHNAMQPPGNRIKKLNEFQLIVLERFTNAHEIYYENHVHKKFLADIYAVIPKGKKCALWFTNKQCWMFQIAKRPYHQPNQPNQHNQTSQHNQTNQTNQPKQPNQPNQPKQLEAVSFDDVRMLTMPCMDDAWYHGEGTILYGTYMYDKKRFSVENVHYFCGIKPQNDGSMNRFIDFFDSLKKCKMEAAQLQFFMPIMHTSFNDALNDAMKITSYEVFCIQHRFLQRACSEYKNLLIHLAEQQPQQSHSPQQPQPRPSQSFFPKQSHVTTTMTTTMATTVMATTVMAATVMATTATSMPMPMPIAKSHSIQSLRTFILKPDAQNDIYYVLHNKDDTITDKTMIAHIPNYKTSVMMNSIFRNIKENRNLDALEESDDEDEFVDKDKNKNQFVDLNKCVRMTCAFNHRFRRWQPCACT